MPWAKLNDREAFDPVWREHGLEAAGLYLLSLAYCAMYLTDGRVDQVWVDSMLARPGVDQELPRKLVRADKWRKVKGGYQIVGYLESNMSASQWRARQEAGRKGAASRHASRSASASASRTTEPEPEP